MSTYESKTNALSIMDVIISSLSRGARGKGVLVKPRATSQQQLLERYATFLGLTKTPQGWRFIDELVSGPEAAYFARGYLEVLLDSSSKIMNFRLEDQLMIFRTAAKWPKEKFIKYAKYATAYPMAKFLQNDLPDRPEGFEGNPLWSGAIKRFLKTRIVARSPKNSRLFFGILQGVKRACMQVPEDFIVEAMVKHRKALTEAPRGIEPIPMIPYYRKFFERFHPKEPKLHEATTSASFESVRSEGGARGWIQGGFMLPEFNQDLTEEGLIAMYETRPGQVQSVYGPGLRFTFDELVEKALREQTSVRVSAILEPLKVRLITKGNTLRYWLSRDYQKQLWRYLQKYPQFALTGRPLMASDLHGLVAREKKLGLSFDKWVSGDYAAATDTLDLRHTKAAFESSLKSHLPVGPIALKPKYQEVLRSVLYEQDILYPENLRRQFGGLEPAAQETGQLMGSTLSFPILCTINLCAYWAALEERFGRKFRIQDLPVLVNGDDILFRCDDQLYRIWLRKTKEVGFELSLGKNYVHPDYLTVNSQLYFHDKKRDMFLHQGVLNAGLLTGQSKVTGRSGAKLAPLWDYFNEVTSGAVDPIRAKRRFIHYHRRNIENLTQKGKFNLHAAFMKGGLGFNPVGELKFTSFQRRYADFMDFQLRDDPENFQKISLVKTRPTNVPRFYHNPKHIVQPKYGPYEEGIVDLKDTTIRMPILSSRLELDDDTDYQSQMRVRFPKSSVMKTFRSRNWRQQKGAIIENRFRLMEYVGTRPVGPMGFTTSP
jgi:hypothetical protein